MGRAFSEDLRRRAVAAYLAGEGSYPQLAARFAVSAGWLRKMVRQQRASGSLTPLLHRRGRKRRITPAQEAALAADVAAHPDRTLAERIGHLGLCCCAATLWHALRRLGLSHKKRRCGPPSRTAPTSPPGGRGGGVGSGVAAAGPTRGG
jgi:transposase